LHRTDAGVECSADFTGVSSPTVHILIYNQGVLVTERTGVPAELGHTLFAIEDWPERLGKLGGRTPCRTGTIKPGTIRFPGGGGGGLLAGPGGETYIGDEFRILAEMPDDAPHLEYYSAFEILTSEGLESMAYELQRTLACTPGSVTITRDSTGLAVTWSEQGFRLQGAEEVTGPWYDLGVSSPVMLNSTHPARFFRLVCD
jgi:hypothetical protein